ncbi:SDR family NAD(P)-dependent oxidoreductase [Streptomyces sp. KS_5]|uniref:SDR family NAD(P)-dependent oxidoreductase n=1 Tax=Streptomyces sp. KS_5 TaxID=1881018 RepID=UPI000897EF10|nr:SDR family NAD(P)-dependent oxidoreductase [Streptomyces sp. KS_5]SEE04163.1 NAD(P)-dependent dehydrogenase, short-chain alcohol dehydrogenase family [Streptomyces sp. KS_5]
MPGSTVVLTGATSGIGEATARRLAATTGRLILHGPESHAEVAPLLREIAALGGAELHYLQADFDDLDDVVSLAARVRELTTSVDVLVNNAGRPGAERRTLSANGHEATWQTNFLAAVLLTHRLAPLLPGRRGRVVHVASATHLSVTLDPDDVGLEHGYSPVRAYARSKLGMVAHARWQAQEWGTDGPRIVSISPGVISTRLLHAMFAVRGAAPDHGARNVIEAATGPIPHSGAYLDDGRPARPNPQVEDPVFRNRLRGVTSRLLTDWL